MANYNDDKKEQKYASEVISLRRVAKVTGGAKRLTFSVLVAVGDRKGRVGLAKANGVDVHEAVQKATKKAERNIITLNIREDTKSIPFRVEGKYKAARIIMKPARVGTGVVAGGSLRKLLELAGVENIVGKSIGSNNPTVNAYCAFTLFNKLKK